MAITFNDVSFKYGNSSILSNLSFSISDNKITGIYGKNSSGKSTISKILSNVILPSSGIVSSLYCKITPTSKKNNKYKKRVGYMPQNLDNWFSCDTVYEEISFVLKNNKLSREQIDYKISELFLELSIDKELYNKRISLLDSGMKKVVALASVVAHNPDLIILDEPFTGLDLNLRKKVMSFIKRLRDEYNKTIIILSSDIDLLVKIVDDLVVIDDGKCIISGKKMDVISRVDVFKNCDLELPSIIDFSEIVKEKKSKKIGYYDDIKDLMKAVYRNV